MGALPVTSSIRLFLLGPFRVEIGGEPVAIRSAPARALLGILALSDGFQETRDRLGTLLWDDASEQNIGNRLRQVRYTLRTALAGGDAGVGQGERPVLSLDPEVFTSDLQDVERALERGEVPDVLLQKADRIETMLSDVPEPGHLFSSWLVLRRKQIQTRIIDGLRSIIERADATAAVRAAKALSVLDRSDELAARYLIRHFAARDEVGKALAHYADLWNHLDEAYDMEPSEATQDLIARIKLGTETGGTSAPPTSSPESASRVRLVLQPETCLAEEDAAGRIGALFRVELLGRLSRFREIDVIDGALAKPGPGDHRLDLTVSDPAGAARINLTLSDAMGRVLWSAQHEEIVQNWMRHIVDVAASVSTACNLQITQARIAEMRRGGPSPRAFDHWVMGQLLLDEFRAASFEKARAHFNAAIEIDTQFSGAYSSLSQVNNNQHLTVPGLKPDPATLHHSRDLANRAIALDPLDSRAHLCRAWASMLLGEHGFATGAFADALSSNPDDPWTVISCALGAAFCGENDEARALLARFEAERWRKTPSIWAYFATILFLLGDCEDSVTAATEAGTAILNIPAWKAAALVESGDMEGAALAWGAFEEAIRLHDETPEPPGTDALLDWLSACFPIRHKADRDRLQAALAKAAGAYLHCRHK